MSARLLGMIRRGALVTSRAVNGALAVVQYIAQGVDSPDDVELFEPVGLACNPPAGGHVLAFKVGGDSDHVVALVSDGRFRPAITAPDTVLYAPVASSKQVRVNASSVKLGSANASKGVARFTDPVIIDQVTFGTWITQMTAAVNALGGGVTPFVGSPTGIISSASGTVQADD